MELPVYTLSFHNKQELHVLHKFLTLSYYIQNGRVQQRAPSMIYEVHIIQEEKVC